MVESRESYRMTSILYTMDDCAGCDKAKAFLTEKCETFRIIPIDNPLLELAVAQLFHDGKAHAPVLVRQDGGVCIPTWTNDKITGWACIARIGHQGD